MRSLRWATVWVARLFDGAVIVTVDLCSHDWYPTHSILTPIELLPGGHNLSAIEEEMIVTVSRDLSRL